MRASLRHLAVFALLALALSPRAARAEADAFGTGRGTGALTISGTVNLYAPITADVPAGATTVTLGTASGTGAFAQDDLVMLWQTTGLAEEPTVPNQASTPLADEKVGLWEFARVLDATPTTLRCTPPTLYAYDADRAQVVSVPEYGDVTVGRRRE
jgi:hypothetical protein